MGWVRTIFKNMSWLMASQIIVSICGFIWTILIARYLGVNDYGILGFAISLTSILGFTIDCGITTYIVRHISTDYDSTPKYIGNAIPLKGIFSIFSFLLILVILILMKSNELTITITLLFLIEVIIQSFLGLINGCFQAYDKSRYQGIENIIVNLILLLFLSISIFSDYGIYGITISYVVANIIGLIYAYYILNKQIAKPKFEFDKSFCKKITILSIPFAIGGFLYSVYYSIDVIMLTNLVGSYATGIYNATYKLITVLIMFYSVYTAVIFPVMSRFYKNDKRLLLISFEKSIKYLLLVIVPIAIATMFYSVDIIQLIYGHQYGPSSSILSILIWTVCLLFISGACNILLNASYKEVSVTKIYLIAAVFNVVLNYFMIPHYSYDGAAITTVLSDALIVTIQFYLIYKLGHRPHEKLYFDVGKILTGTAILGIALYFLKLNMWVALPVGIIIYLATLYLLRLFDDDDKYVIREVLGKN